MRIGILGSTRDHRRRPAGVAVHHNNVPFVFQTHGNLCGDAAAAMLLRWAARDPQQIQDENRRAAMLADNLILIPNGPWGEDAAFQREVRSYQKLAEDKLRDRAIALYEKFLAEHALHRIWSLRQARDQIPSEDARNLRDEVVMQSEAVGRIIAGYRDIKAERDRRYGGPTSVLKTIWSPVKRWERHKTKRDGFGERNAFNDLYNALRAYWWRNPQVSIGARRNPRGIFRGADIGHLVEWYGLSFFDGLELETEQILRHFLTNLLTENPVAVVISTTGPILHWIVVVGIHGDQVFYHDPWRGQNRERSWEDFYRRWYREEGILCP